MSTKINLMVFIPFDGTPDEPEGVLVIRQDDFGFIPPSNMILQNEDNGPCIELDPEKPFKLRRVSDWRERFDFLSVYAKKPKVSRSEIIASFTAGLLWFIYDKPPTFDRREDTSLAFD